MMKIETPRHRWSARLHFWLAPGNLLRVNMQPTFSEIMIGRCVNLCHSWRGTAYTERMK